MARSRLWNAGVGLTALGVVSAGYIGADEGLALRAYRDVVGVWTACRGETENIGPNMTFTEHQCDKMLVDRLVKDFEPGMRACLKEPDKVPDKVYTVFLSLSYNIGVGGFCGSSMRRLANVGDYRDACHAVRAWNKGGRPKRFIKGLDNRRKRDEAYCLSGL